MSERGLRYIAVALWLPLFQIACSVDRWVFAQVRGLSGNEGIMAAVTIIEFLIWIVVAACLWPKEKP